MRSLDGVCAFSWWCHADGLVHDDNVIMKYRMARDIMNVANLLIYGGRLRCGSKSVADGMLPNRQNCGSGVANMFSKRVFLFNALLLLLFRIFHHGKQPASLFRINDAKFVTLRNCCLHISTACSYFLYLFSNQ